MKKKQPSLLFALDIGTRSVVGLILRSTDDEKFTLVDSVIVEHEERAMHDGQIHDVQAVAKTIHHVKSQLENLYGPLNKVCVAAAGRSLKTKKTEVEFNISGKEKFTEEDILHLELSAVQEAQFQLANERSKEAHIDYYCVGYSVLHYTLDHELIGNLVDQTGKKATVSIIATFLPTVVIESLLASLERADLELEALTLEPIAAINVLVPPSMRRLNIALVDIGAGTSDIALTDEDTIIAYGMVPIAGDEITESLSDQFLLDFPEAEKIKRTISIKDEVQITDILGIETTYQKDEIMTPLDDVIKRLAQTISNEILSLNGKAPKAVMLIGGGSLTPNLPKEIATSLGLPSNRVAIRDAQAIKQLEKTNEQRYGPELVTPIGIAIASQKHAIQSIQIKVNNDSVRLFDVKKLTVGDGLLAAGVNIAKLYGKPGLALMVTVNDQLITIPGKHGQPPLLLKNGQKTTLDERLMAGDEITVERGLDGEQAHITVSQLLGDLPVISVTVNGKACEIQPTVFNNGQAVTMDCPVSERDQIEVNEAITVRDLLKEKEIPLTAFSPFHFYINNERKEINSKTNTVLLNGNKKPIDSIVKNGDEINVEENAQIHTYSVAEVLQMLNIRAATTVSIFFNSEPVKLSKTNRLITRDNIQLTSKDFVYENDRLIMTELEDHSFILQDLFAVVDIDLPLSSGKTYTLNKNNKEATFTDPIIDGDKIELIFT